MRDFLVEFVNYNGPVIMMIIAFIAGFAGKIVACYILDSEIDNIVGMDEARRKNENAVSNGIIAEISKAYIRENKDNNIKNTKVFVDNMLNMWKEHGISVDKIEKIGDMCGYISIAVSAFFDMVLLTERENLSDSLNILVCVYVYSALAVIFYAVLRLWEGVVNSQYKKKLLSDAITNYIDNYQEDLRTEYMKTEHTLSQEHKDSGKNTANSNNNKPGVKVTMEKSDEMVNAQDKDRVSAIAGKENIGENNKENSSQNINDKISRNINDNISENVNENNIEDKENVITQVLDEYLA